MPPFVHCNRCSELPVPGLQFYFSSCGHLYCRRCVDIVRESKCVVCKQSANFVEIFSEQWKKVPRDIQLMFMDPAELMKKLHQVLVQALHFQKQQRDRYINGVRMKVSQFRQYQAHFQAQQMKKVELEKRRHFLLAEKKRLMQRLETLAMPAPRVPFARSTRGGVFRAITPRATTPHGMTPRGMTPGPMMLATKPTVSPSRFSMVSELAIGSTASQYNRMAATKAMMPNVNPPSTNSKVKAFLRGDAASIAGSGHGSHHSHHSNHSNHSNHSGHHPYRRNPYEEIWQRRMSPMAAATPRGDQRSVHCNR